MNKARNFNGSFEVDKQHDQRKNWPRYPFNLGVLIRLLSMVAGSRHHTAKFVMKHGRSWFWSAHIIHFTISTLLLLSTPFLIHSNVVVILGKDSDDDFWAGGGALDLNAF
ncbi:hypothetical protein DM02DRAFT_626249 [Periconia macrospinosa]|uniref:Transmembrane protein n=1 Tax=Periconia macrospinosa TaxID=97972 RepID=A0A2V1DYA7_9PLEO|nr:hypothetical protein DM02DRAFT_626249 [Periconia macrospinosa]